MLTVKERPLVKFFQYIGIFSVSRGSPRATNNVQHRLLYNFCLFMFFTEFERFIFSFSFSSQLFVEITCQEIVEKLISR